jgi:regulatory protein
VTGLRPSKPEPKDLLTVALRMLGRRPYSTAELRWALERKSRQSELISAAIARLRQLGYLDDRKFAEQYAYSLAHNRSFGPLRIRRELKAKLVKHEEIEPAIERVYQETPAVELLQKALDKRLRASRLPLTRGKFHSLCRSLMRMGFSSGDIIKAMRARPELTPVAEEVEPVDLEGEANSEL